MDPLRKKGSLALVQVERLELSSSVWKTDRLTINIYLLQAQMLVFECLANVPSDMRGHRVFKRQHCRCRALICGAAERGEASEAQGLLRVAKPRILEQCCATFKIRGFATSSASLEAGLVPRLGLLLNPDLFQHLDFDSAPLLFQANELLPLLVIEICAIRSKFLASLSLLGTTREQRLRQVLSPCLGFDSPRISKPLKRCSL